MRAISKTFLLELKLLLREPASFLFLLVFPAVMALLLGLSGPAQGVKALTIQTLGFLAISPMVFGLMSFPVTLVTYRERGMLRRLRVTPLSPLAYLIAQGFMGLLMVLVSGLIMVLVCMAVLKIEAPQQPLSVALAFTLGTIAFISVGAVLGSLVSTVRMLQIVSTLVFGGMVFSLFVGTEESASSAVKAITRWLPVSHMMEMVSGLWYGAVWGDQLENIGVLIGVIVVSLVVAATTFRWE